jgi:two-component system response regulator
LHALSKNIVARSVHIVRDGEEALNFLFCREEFQERSTKPLPNLILLDLKLPKVDGLSVLRALKEDRVLRSIPVVILTSSREEKDLARSYEIGVNSYIQKPVDFDCFLKTVDTLGLYWLVMNQSPPLQAASAPMEGVG